MIRFLQTPGPTKKIVLGGLLLIICAAMVITLVPGGIGSSIGLGGPGQGVYATVDGQKIESLEVQSEARQMIAQQFPGNGGQAAMLLPYFAARAADSLITGRMLVVEADRMGLQSSDEELKNELQHGRYGSTFFPNGTFVGETQYEDMLQQHNLTVTKFEQDVKDQIKLDKLESLIISAAYVSDAEVHQEFLNRNTKIKFDYALLKKDDLAKGIHASDAELNAYYEHNKAAYNNTIPEKRKVQFVVLDKSKLAGQIQVTPQDLQSYYDQHRDEFRVPEQVNVRHILIKTPLPGTDGKVDQKGVDDAHAKANDVLKQLKAGGDFSELAKKYSEDTGSAKEGGSLGWIGRGRTVPEFEKAAFSLPRGSTSDVVQSSYGFHIIRVDDKQDAHLKLLGEVKPQIEPVVKELKAAQIAENHAKSVLAQARSQGLDKAAAAAGLQVVTTDFVAHTDSLPGIGSDPKFMDAVFAEQDKAPPDEAQINSGYAIFQLQGIKPPATPTFEEVRDKVTSKFKDDRAASLLQQKTQELSDRAKAEHDLKKAAKELGAIIKTSDLVAPDGQVPDIGSMTGPAAAAFTLKPGEISGPVENGNTGAVLLILEKQQPTDQDFAAKKDEIRQALLANKQQELFGMFVTNLRAQMEKSGKVKINADEKKKLEHAQNAEEGD